MTTGEMTAVDSCGGDYVELMDISVQRKFVNQDKMEIGRVFPARRMSSRLHGRPADQKENNLELGSSRASLYRDKVPRVQLDPLQPLTNPYRMSAHDQMPVRVFPLPSLNEKFNSIPSSGQQNDTKNGKAVLYRTPQRKVTFGNVDMVDLKNVRLTPQNRANSYDDLLMTSSRHYITRSSMKRLRQQAMPSLDESNFSLSSNEEKTPELSQTLTRNKLRSSKTRKYRQRFNFGIFTKNSRNKSRSEFALNETERMREFETTESKKNINEGNSMNDCCMNNNIEEISSPSKGNFRRRRRLSSIRSRFNKKFSKEEKIMTDTDVRDTASDARLKSSPWKRKSEVICNKMCEDFENNNNQPISLRDVLNDKDLCEEFRHFLSNEHSDENLDFWIICEKYRSIIANTDRSNLAEIIFRQFLGSGAPREVNLDAKTRSQLDSNLEVLDQESFVPAQECIYKLMEEDSFRRFCWMKKSKRTRHK